MTYRADRLAWLLRRYWAFKILRCTHYIGVRSITGEYYLITAVMILMLTGGAIRDRSLILPHDDIGLLEHPTMWSFFIVLIIAPLVIFRIIRFLDDVSQWGKHILTPEFLTGQSRQERSPTDKYLFDSNLSKITLRVFTAVGVAAFAWNSLQNQAPLKFLGFDFWDSINYAWGYWLSRVFKLYLWILLFPALSHIVIMLLFNMRRIMAEAGAEGAFMLQPYHPDGCGGTRIFINSIIKLLSPVIIISGTFALIVLNIHRKIDPTTITAILIGGSFFFICYLIPAFSLRNAILKAKQRELSRIAMLQQKIASGLCLGGENIDCVKNGVDAINSLDTISRRLRSIPNWPQLTYLAKVVGFVASPSFITIILKLLSKS